MIAEGAFLVSDVRQNRITQYVNIESLAGEPCKVKTDIKGQVKIDSECKFSIQNDGVIELKLSKGQTATIYSTGYGSVGIECRSVIEPNL